jgi:hypothetical protein
LPRIRQILHSGTIVFNFYRYWWQGLDADADELAAVLEKFPDSDPARAFRSDDCTVVLLAGKSYQPSLGNLSLPSNGIELSREVSVRKRLFSGSSFWDALISLAQSSAPAYLGYSYLRRADIFVAAILPEQAASLARAAEKLAPRCVRALTTQIVGATRILFLCPRKV